MTMYCGTPIQSIREALTEINYPAVESLTDAQLVRFCDIVRAFDFGEIKIQGGRRIGRTAAKELGLTDAEILQSIKAHADKRLLDTILGGED